MIKEQPLVSVVVPCYNHEKYIEQCVMSIVNQTYPNIELIVIDDGSSDGSCRILEQLAGRYGFTFISQQNIGLAATLNKGVKNYAKGKYIGCVASDDYWKEDKIEKQVAFLKGKDDFAFVFSRASIVDNNGKILKDIPENKPTICEFYSLLRGNFIPALTVLIKRDAFLAAGGYDETLYIEDWDMWLRLADKHPFGFIDESLAFYRLHGSNMSSKAFKMLKAEQQILRKWQHKKEFRHVYKWWAVNAFNVLAPTEKKFVIRELLGPSFLYYKKRIFYKALAKLLVKWK
jgi:glycosyltransferase involved in cell wall biosynthesis